MSRYRGHEIDLNVKFIGNFGGIFLTKDKVYHAIKESFKFGHRIYIEIDDTNTLGGWYKYSHFKTV